MKREIFAVVLFCFAVFLPGVCSAVDETSVSHKAGQVAGAIFLIVFAFWIVRRLLAKPSF